MYRLSATVWPSLRLVYSHYHKAIITNFMSDALVDLFKTLQVPVHRVAGPVDPTPLIHDALLGLVNDAIALLR